MILARQNNRLPVSLSSIGGLGRVSVRQFVKRLNYELNYSANCLNSKFVIFKRIKLQQNSKFTSSSSSFLAWTCTASACRSRVDRNSSDIPSNRNACKRVVAMGGRIIYWRSRRCCALLIFVLLHQRCADGFQSAAMSTLIHHVNCNTSPKTIRLWAETDRRRQQSYPTNYRRTRRRKGSHRSSVSYQSRQIMKSFEEACQKRRHFDDDYNITSRLDNIVDGIKSQIQGDIDWQTY